jgi:hypothetical protein
MPPRVSEVGCGSDLRAAIPKAPRQSLLDVHPPTVEGPTPSVAGAAAAQVTNDLSLPSSGVGIFTQGYVLRSSKGNGQ